MTQESRDAEDRIVYAMFTAFMFLLAAGGGFVHHLITKRPPLTFSERWPDSDAIIKWRLHEDYLAEKKGRSI